jgi:hypothetical protein
VAGHRHLGRRKRELASDNAVLFGSDSQTGAQFVFDVTLFAQLSEVDTPLLRLRNLKLNLAGVTP